MNWVRAFATVLVAMSALLAQQECPGLRAEEVPVSRRLGPLRRCGSSSWVYIQGLKLNKGGVCPDWVVITPTHQRSVPSNLETIVVVYNIVPEIKLIYECNIDWWLFIPNGWECEQTRQVRIGGVRMRKTMDCASFLLASR